MPEKKKKKSNSEPINIYDEKFENELLASFNDHPFLNDKLYPLIGISTTRLIDSYLSKNYRPYTKNIIDGINLDDIFDNEMSDIIKKSSEFMMDFYDYYSGNNMENMYKEFELFKKDYKYDPKKSKNSFGDIPPRLQNSKAVKTIIDRAKCKLDFLDHLAEKLEKDIYTFLPEYSDINKDYTIVIDKLEMVAFNMDRGIISKRGSVDDEDELEILRGNIYPGLQFVNKKYGLDVDSLFCTFLSLGILIKGRPLGIFINDSKKGAKYIPSRDVIKS